MKELEVSDREAGQRLDKYLGKYLNEAPKSFIYKMLRKKNIKLNDKKADGKEIITSGDKIRVYLADETIGKFRKVSTRQLNYDHLEVVYEDDNLLICNKPKGLLSQKDDQDSISLIDLAIAYLQDTGEYNPEANVGFKPGLCNRLDRNTSGLVIIGKNLMALQQTNEAIRDHSIKKYYLTIVKGEISQEQELIDHWEKNQITNQVNLSKNGIKGKIVKTIIKPIKSYKNFTKLEVELVTGKSHQIRAHLKSIGHPILGDSKYGDPSINQVFKVKCQLSSQLLHAYKIVLKGFHNELNYLNNIEFVNKEPIYFAKVQNFIERRMGNGIKKS